MKTKRFSEEQIIGVLKEAEAGAKTKDLCRRHGIAEMLVLHIIEEAMLKRGYIGECSLILENNQMMNRFLEAIGAEKYKTYRIYRRPLNGKGPE